MVQTSPGVAQRRERALSVATVSPLPSICRHCGQPISEETIRRRHGRRGLYCSPECGWIGQRRSRPPIAHPDDPGVCLVPLTRGHFAVIDRADTPLVESHCWSVSVRRNRCYAYRDERRGGRRQTIYMHQIIMGVEHGELPDHIDGDGLNNRRANLRPTVSGQNNANQRLRSDNTSGFKGVAWDKNRQSWVAQISQNGVHRGIGRFATAEEAAKAYDDSARELFGAFARLNFPREGERQA